MIPDKTEFLKQARRGNVIPVYEELFADLETPVSAFLKISKGQPHAFLLESVEGEEKIARFSFVGIKPRLIYKNKKGEDPFKEIERIMKRYRFVTSDDLPRFQGGLVGYLSYDAVRYCEKIPNKNPDLLALPQAYLMLADQMLIFDHARHKVRVVVNAFVGEKDPLAVYRQAAVRIQELIRLIQKPPVESRSSKKQKIKKLQWKSNISKQEFEQIVLKTKEYIRAGDIIQGVLSQRFETKTSVDPFKIYRALRSINPSPYMFYLKLNEVTLVGSSPEILVRCEDGIVDVRPIAGTRPRGKDESQDQTLEKELLKDPKERAEHIMLVDLGRNDIGRVCVKGTVKVTELMAVERYSHVMHIVSNVTGKLAPGKTPVDVIKAVFPAGTVTGAPKIRAMEIIDELENIRRGPYAGAVGYFSFSGNLDSCITIRTVVIKGKKAYIQAGAGIVADSEPAREYQETVNKAKGMMKAVEMAGQL